MGVGLLVWNAIFQ